MNADKLRQVAELLRLMDGAYYSSGSRYEERAASMASGIIGQFGDFRLFDGDYDYEAGLKDFLGEDGPGTFVFVYGTLKRGNSNAAVLEGAHFVDVATVENYGLTSGGGFPYAIPAEGMQVHGELYEVDEETFQRLDRLEGFPWHYTRDLVNVVGTDTQAWIYVAGEGTQRRIKDESVELVDSWESSRYADTT